MRIRFGLWRFTPLSHGRWVSWLMHDVCSPDEDMPSPRRLRYGVRHARSQQAQHYYSEPHPGMAPCLEVWLTRIDATTRTGRRLTLWRTEALIQLFAGVHRVNLTEHRSFTHEDNARDHFCALTGMRSQLCDPPDEG